MLCNHKYTRTAIRAYDAKDVSMRQYVIRQNPIYDDVCGIKGGWGVILETEAAAMLFVRLPAARIIPLNSEIYCFVHGARLQPLDMKHPRKHTHKTHCILCVGVLISEQLFAHIVDDVAADDIASSNENYNNISCIIGFN